MAQHCHPVCLFFERRAASWTLPTKHSRKGAWAKKLNAREYEVRVAPAVATKSYPTPEASIHSFPLSTAQSGFIPIFLLPSPTPHAQVLPKWRSLRLQRARLPFWPVQSSRSSTLQPRSLKAALATSSQSRWAARASVIKSSAPISRMGWEKS